MDVISGLLSEDEFRLFSAEDYQSLQNLIDDSIASQILDYINSTGQDAFVLDNVKCFLFPLVEALTFPTKLHDDGYVDMVAKLTPQILFSPGQDEVYLKDVHRKLQFLENNYDKLVLRTPTRTRADFDDFRKRMNILVTRALCTDAKLTYPDLVERIDANRFVFYSPQDKGHSTLLGIITKKHRVWTLCLRGLDYKVYCDAKGIPMNMRRSF